MMHLSFTREIRGNLRVNGNSQRQLALQFANSTLNNTYHGKLQFERGDDEKRNRTVKVLINLSCYTLRFSHFIISLYNLSRIQSEYHTWKLFGTNFRGDDVMERFMHTITQRQEDSTCSDTFVANWWLITLYRLFGCKINSSGRRENYMHM